MLTGRSRGLAVLGAVVALAAPLLLTLAAGAAEDPTVPVPIGMGADFTVLSKATTSDPVEIQGSGSWEIEFARLSVAPNGTTGLWSHRGTTVVSVQRGVATALTDGEGGCASRTVTAGLAFVQPPGTVSEIRNQGSEPLELYATTLTPTGVSASAVASPVSCPVSTLAGVTADVLNRSTIDRPFLAQTNGTTDVYVALVRVQPGAEAGGWHVHPGPVFVAVDQGEFTIRIAHNGQCDVEVFPAKTGGLEMAEMVHAGHNGGTTPTSVYILGFAPTPQPLLVPTPAPEECTSS